MTIKTDLRSQYFNILLISTKNSFVIYQYQCITIVDAMCNHVVILCQIPQKAYQRFHW